MNSGVEVSNAGGGAGAPPFSSFAPLPNVALLAAFLSSFESFAPLPSVALFDAVPLRWPRSGDPVTRSFPRRESEERAVVKFRGCEFGLSNGSGGDTVPVVIPPIVTTDGA
jgi:hypothetical protein